MPRTVKKDANLQTGHPAKPTNLSERAPAEWNRLISELDAESIRLTPAHRTALSMVATIAADIASAWEAVKTDGAYIMGKAGLVAHPATKRLDALRRDYFKVLSMLGLRTAVADGGEAKEETLAEALGR